MRADVVIAADGAYSFITQDAGLRGKPESEDTAIGVKELIGLPREVIEERFHLKGNEGAAYAIVGWATRGVPGGGFLYTNIDSLSIGIVAPIAGLVKNKVRSGEMMENFMHHPMIAPLVQGGKLLEYGAHIVPEGGSKRCRACLETASWRLATRLVWVSTAGLWCAAWTWRLARPWQPPRRCRCQSSR
jgi:electron transfer flavoprotein-quinone oxidoreductase